MKKILTLCILISLSFSNRSLAESAIQQFNELGYGTLSGRIQSLTMYRDYDDGNNNYSSTLGLQLDYLSPVIEGWSIGASYTGAGVLDSMDNDESNQGDRLLANGRVNVLNEGYLSYNLAALGYTNTTATVGRRVHNGEVFRADDFRQKKRSLEAVSVETRDIHSTRLQVGYSWKESNMWSTDSNPVISSWKFEDYGDVFNTGYDTDGITWGELVNNCIEDLEVAVFNAHAYDIANLFGVRAKYSITEDTAILGYYRNESDVGRADSRHSDAFGLSVAQQVGSIKLEGGYFGVHGQDLRFQELTTGINHALGSSLMIYSGQFNGGSDTVYLKAATTLEQTKTGLYALYNYTWHDHDKTGYDGQEFNLVIKQPVPKIDNLTVCFKGGIGYRDGSGQNSTTATDARLFATYTF